MFDRGIKRARFVVIRDITIPGVLIEGGFLSNSYDAKLINTPEYRQQMAACIFTAVQNYRRAVSAGATQYAAKSTEAARPETAESPTAPDGAAAAPDTTPTAN